MVGRYPATNGTGRQSAKVSLSPARPRLRAPWGGLQDGPAESSSAPAAHGTHDAARPALVPGGEAAGRTSDRGPRWRCPTPRTGGSGRSPAGRRPNGGALSPHGRQGIRCRNVRSEGGRRGVWIQRVGRGHRGRGGARVHRVRVARVRGRSTRIDGVRTRGRRGRAGRRDDHALRRRHARPPQQGRNPHAAECLQEQRPIGTEIARQSTCTLPRGQVAPTLRNSST
jgi:hypothetical protein